MIFIGTDQVQNFLNRHHGPGVQHVAFKSTSIIEDTQIWFKNGVEFLSPPAEYYKIVKLSSFFFLFSYSFG